MVRPRGTIPGGRITKKTDLAIIAGSVGLGLGVFFQPLRWMVGAWLSDPYYSHGFLVPLISAALAWREWRRLDSASVRPVSGGLALLGLALAIALVAIQRQAYFLASLAIPLALAGVIAYLYGWTYLRALLFPLAYLVLMVPLPFVAEAALRLQVWTSAFSARVANVLGVAAQADGASVSIPGLAYVVGLACSGLSSIVALLALGALLVYLFQGAGWAKVTLLAAIVPIAMLSNGLRVASLLWVANQFGGEVGLRYHDTVAGFLSWGAAVALLILAGRLLRCRLSLAVWQ